MKIGYARVSTREQNLDMQVFALEDAGCEKIYEEVVSGANYKYLRYRNVEISKYEHKT